MRASDPPRGHAPENRARGFSFCPLAQEVTGESADAAGILGYEK
jgi:hypothetical protein